MHVHLGFDIGPEVLTTFKGSIPASVTVTTGELPPPETQIFVTGFPAPEILKDLKHLTTVIIPFAGLQPRSREALLEFPHLKVYNLHHNAPATAEKAIELMLAVAKRTVPHDSSMRLGDWFPRFDKSDALQLAGRTALVIGYGEIGKRVAKACAALEMDVHAVKRTAPDGTDGPVKVFSTSALPQLWTTADVVLVCAPLTPETTGLLDEWAIAKLPSQAIVVNIGRGGIIDERALFEALKDRRIHGAGLDVWWKYPTSQERCAPSEFPYEDLDNVVMSPHNGGTVDSTEPARFRALAELLVNLIQGTCVQRPVEPARGY